MSVFAACAAGFAKTPAENGMLSHARYLRELLDTRALKASAWTDTRGAVAVGTKGAVDRELFRLAVSGTSRVQHAM
eukprot:1350367-Alexandrium_andersonii.AAC.1